MIYQPNKRDTMHYETERCNCHNKSLATELLPISLSLPTNFYIRTKQNKNVNAEVAKIPNFKLV